MRYAPIDPALFVENRRRFTERMTRNSLALFCANDLMPTSADGVHPFVQQTDLFWLCGVDQPETCLILFPEAPDPRDRQILFIKETSEAIAVWEGAKLTREEARQATGIDQVLWESEFRAKLRNLMIQAQAVYLNTNEHPRAADVVQSADRRLIRWCHETFPLHAYRRAAPILHTLRAVKSPLEVDLIRRACAITEKAFRRVLGFIRPGVWEFEIQAEILHEFVRNRSRRPAFETIVASGAQTCVLHYVKNDQQCRDGDLVLMDFGAEYANYAADITRTVPVGGRYSQRQRQLYQAVRRIQIEAISMLVPGNTLKAYHEAVGRVVERELVALGLLDRKDVARQPADKPLYKRYFMHGTSHHLGLDVHDYGHAQTPFEAGMVMTCEPGIYIPDEGMGVRIENDILITEQGPQDLTATVPVEADEIEALMAGEDKQSPNEVSRSV